MRKKKKINKILLYVMICLVGIVMMYPLVWMFFATFKDNSEIFGTLKLLPNSFSFDASSRAGRALENTAIPSIS